MKTYINEMSSQEIVEVLNLGAYKGYPLWASMDTRSEWPEELNHFGGRIYLETSKPNYEDSFDAVLRLLAKEAAKRGLEPKRLNELTTVWLPDGEYTVEAHEKWADLCGPCLRSVPYRYFDGWYTTE